MGTKKEELASKTGCLAKAAADEPIFVLRAQDMIAPGIVRTWVAHVRLWFLPAVVNRDKLQAKITEAEALADQMEAWQREHGCKVPD